MIIVVSGVGFFFFWLNRLSAGADPVDECLQIGFLEDGRITRLGGTEERKLDVRVLAATHRDLLGTP